jgi:glutamine synthetase
MELRLGDASANPYLAVAALLAAAYLGIRDGLKPPPKLEGYGYDTSKAEMLPSDLGTAIEALELDKDIAKILGPAFVAAFVAYKRDELQRFGQYVTDWEFREYAYHL